MVSVRTMTFILLRTHIRQEVIVRRVTRGLPRTGMYPFRDVFMVLLCLTHSYGVVLSVHLEKA